MRHGKQGEQVLQAVVQSVAIQVVNAPRAEVLLDLGGGILSLQEAPEDYLVVWMVLGSDALVQVVGARTAGFLDLESTLAAVSTTGGTALKADSAPI